MRDDVQDWLDAALAQAPQWEPPTGFALSVVSASRKQRTPIAPTLRRERLLLGRWWPNAALEAVRSRIESSLWVLRQYRSVIGR